MSNTPSFTCNTLLSNTLGAPTYALDGWFNNPEFPASGSAGSLISRYGPIPKLEYDIPDIFNLTKQLYYNVPRKADSAHPLNSAFFFFLAQFVFMDLVDVSEPTCPRDFVLMSSHGPSIVGVAEGRYGTWMTRSERSIGISESTSCTASWTWRRTITQQAKNWATGYLDGSAIYGTSGQALQLLRSYRKGKLGDCSLDGNSCSINMEKVSDAFRSSDDSRDFPQSPRSPYIDSIRLMWLNWHNHIADAISANLRDNTNLSDDDIFKEARRWTIASFQSVVFNELLPLFFNVTAFRGNTQVTSPISIYDSFAAAAISYSLFYIPPVILQLSEAGKCASSKTLDKTKRMCRSLSSNLNLLDALLDLTSSPAKAMDFTLINDLSAVSALDRATYDIFAVSIGRGRDLSLPTYSEMRSFLNFNSKVKLTWPELRKECNGISVCLNYVSRLEQIYQDADHVELIPGGAVNFGMVFGKIMSAQFNNIRQGDMFWYSSNKTAQFSAAQISCIDRISLSTILSVVLNSTSKVQKNPLLFSESSCWKSVTNYSFVVNNTIKSADCPVFIAPLPEVVLPLGLTMAGIVIFTLLVILCLYWPKIAKNVKRHTRLVQKQRSPGGENLFAAKEYLGWHRLKRKWRPVLIESNINERSIRLIDPVDGKTVLRKVLFLDPHQRHSISVAGRRASQIINHSESLRIVMARRKSPVQPKRKVFVLTEAKCLMSLRIPADAHLALKFASDAEYNRFCEKLIAFASELHIDIVRAKASKSILLELCVTKDQHRKRIEALLRSALLEASDSQVPRSGGLLSMAGFSSKGDAVPFDEILHMCELTLPELASLLRTDVSDKFTVNLFNFIDKDKRGAVAYRDLVDFMAQIAKGNDRDRLNLLFRLYDTDGDGKLSFDEFATMIASLSAIGNQQIPDSILENLFEEIVQQQESHLTTMDEVPMMKFDDLWRLFQQHGSRLNLGAMTLPGIFPDDWSAVQNKIKPKVVMSAPQQDLSLKLSGLPHLESSSALPPLEPVIEQLEDPVFVEPNSESDPDLDKKRPSIVSAKLTTGNKARYARLVNSARSLFDNHKLELFWGTLYVCICLGLFALRFAQSYFSQTALIGVVGLGAPFARAGAIVINFTFATLILTMARNIFTAIRDSGFRHYFPFDALVEIHKFVAVINLLASTLHIFSHVANFYYLSQLPLSDLWCLMPELKGVRPPPGHNIFVWLGYETLTGLTGFLLIAVYVPIFAFAFGRSFAFRQFWITHQLWPVAAVLLGIHGLGCLLQTPLFYAFFLGPAIILIIDRVISSLQRHADLLVVSCTALPSGVSRLVFEKPQDIQYVAGQYVRICVPECGHEFHPFTLTSAPHEANMSLHILSVGPWTKKLNKLVSTPGPEKPLSIVRIEGPYGEGHQDWHRSDVAVLVGAGIGVTPFASILKHISHMLSFSYMPYSCQKVYFFWITRNQKQFEWFTDIIREVEAIDVDSFVSTHICITQFQSKFDFRTIMLYICERHFQKLHGRSIFTGLKSTTHFGRPNFEMTLQNLKEVHPNARSIGVFTCGPSALIPTVEKAVRENNKHEGPLITHYYEVF